MSPSNATVDIGAIMAQDLETIHGALYPASSLTVASKTLFEDGDGTSETVCRTKVEGRIDELQSEIRALKSCLNATTITCRLPPEILARIFAELISSGPPGGYASRRSSWIRVTHVCRRWRAVALTFPALWSSITTTHGIWAELMLCRSKEAPLSVEIDPRSDYCRPDAFKAFLSKIFHHGNRLRLLELNVSETDMLAHFPAAVPRLQQLILASGPRYSGVTAIQLPAHILSDTAPELERLEIEGFSIPWKTLPSAPKLTFLRLAQDPSGDRLSPAALAESIGRLPLLQNVDIAGFLPREPSVPVSESLHFPAMQSLTLRDTFSAVVNFLRSCTPFRAQTVELVMSDTIPTAETASTFFAILAALWKDTVTDKYQAQLGMQALHLKGLEAFNQNLIFEVHYRQYDLKANSKPDLRISFPVPAATVPQVVSSFLESFNASTTRWLTVALGDDSSLCGLWESTFSRWNALETLQFMGGRTIFAFVSAMQEKWAQSILKRSTKTSRSNKRPFFPVLSTIKCTGVDFDMAEHGLGIDAADLARLLRQMKRAHLLRELYLNYCRNFTSDDYDHIKEKAPGLDVKWDGDEDIDESEDEDEFELECYDYFGYDYDSDYDYF